MSPPKTLDKNSCRQFLIAVQNLNGTPKQKRRGTRNYAMTLLMLDAGLRVGELVQLRISALCFGNRAVENILVTPEIAKNRRERSVPVSNRLANALDQLRFYYWTQAEIIENCFAFKSTAGKGHFTTRQVERIVRGIALTSLGQVVHPHMLRHTFASRLVRVTNTSVVQQLLGHNRLSSTQVYIHPNAEDLKQAIHQVEERDKCVAGTQLYEPSTMSDSDRLNAVDADRNVT